MDQQNAQPKYAAENKLFIYDFSKTTEILNGDTLSGITGIASIPAGLTFTSESISGNTVIARASGGTGGLGYETRCQVTTAGGSTLINAVWVYVSS